MPNIMPAHHSPRGCNNEEFLAWLEHYTPTHMYGDDRMRAFKLAGIKTVHYDRQMLVYTHGRMLAAMARANMVRQVTERLA